jgi:hypothetical protein
MKKALMRTAACLIMLCVIPAHAVSVIQAFDADSMPRLVAGQKGKPFVLVVWSLDCEYCQTSLQNLTQEKRKGRTLNIVTLSTDAAADAQAVKLMKMKLRKFDIDNDAWAYGAAAPEQLRYAIDPNWHGEKPRSYWFNARGESVAYSGVITPAIINRLAARP